ncbi:MAG: UDP-2,3-diacylglucosamine diphosphatase [Candidatus Omnitrophica bacterium]|nr:UDP-2,3-diacylglucosamine diphosphatase [Candidatus Omnitrophota bacterium]
MLDYKAKIFISDLHLGDGSRADDFHRKDELLKLLEIAAKENFLLIVVGDLFELWQSDLKNIILEHREIIDKLLYLRRNGKLLHLIGNHDHIPFVKYIGTGLGVELEYNDAGIWAEHGNQYDIFNRYQDPRLEKRNKWGRACAFVVGWMERLLHPDIDEWVLDSLIREEGVFTKHVGKLKKMITPSSSEYIKKGGDLSEYEEAAKKRIETGEKIVVFGHTHRPKLKKITGGIYANCGCWCGKEQIPTYIKVDSGKVTLVNGIDHTTINSLEL